LTAASNKSTPIEIQVPMVSIRSPCAAKRDPRRPTSAAREERADEAARARRFHGGVARHRVDRSQVIRVGAVAQAKREDGKGAGENHIGCVLPCWWRGTKA
jgi:hypothetical protein